MFHARSTRLVGLVAFLSLLLTACPADDTDVVTEPDMDEAEPEPEPETEPEADDETPADEDVEHSYEDGDVITLIVPTAPGGGFDTQSRILQPYLEEELQGVTDSNVRVQVETMPGGGHLVGMQYAAQSDPDGLTLLYAQSDIGMGHQVIEGADFDMTALTPLGTLGVNAVGLFTRTDLELPSRDFDGLAQRSQEEPLLIGHTGEEAHLRMMMGMLEEEGVHFSADLVTLEGTSGVMASLLRQEIEVGFTSPPGAMPIVEDNPDELEFILALGCEPNQADPSVPTIVEQGVPRANEICSNITQAWRIIFAPPGLPAGDAAVVTESLRNVVNNPDFQEELLATGFEPSWMEPDEVEAYLAELVQIWEELAQYAE